MNLPNGWGSARDARPGTPLWKRQFPQRSHPSGVMKSSEKRQEPVILKDISLSEDERQTTQIGELDRVLGGGIVPGSLCFSGEEIRESENQRCFLQVCRNLAEKAGFGSLYFRRGISETN